MAKALMSGQKIVQYSSSFAASLGHYPIGNGRHTRPPAQVNILQRILISHFRLQGNFRSSIH
eukprot:5029894-Karenia_brevis.AAC.1